jgi:N-acetylmuramoyl-L-alanine amidase
MNRRRFLSLSLPSVSYFSLPTRSSAEDSLAPAISLQSDNWISQAIKKKIDGGSVMPNPKFLVIHYTEGMSALSSIDYWKSSAAKGVCAHFVIERTGELYQCRSCQTTCWHVGASQWKGVAGLNSCSIGIELANAGCKISRGLLFGKYPARDGFIEAQHKHGGPVRQWEIFPSAQLKTCFALARALTAQFRFQDILGHDDAAPGRKIDPGPGFPMEALKAHCGSK